MVWSIAQNTSANGESVNLASGLTATYSSTPTQDNELVAFAVARPANSATSTNVLSMSGWTKIRQQNTSSHSIAIFHKTAGASESTGHTLTATVSGDTSMDAVLVLFEVSGGTFATPDVDENSNTASSVSSFSDSFTPSSTAPRFVAAIGTIRQNANTQTLAWDGTNKPANDPHGAQMPANGQFASASFIARCGWEEVTSTSTRTFEVDCSASASAAMIIVGWPEEGGAVDLTVADAAVATTIDTVTLEVEGTLAVADIAVSTTIDTVALTQVHNLTVADITVATTIDTVTITGPDEFTSDFPGTSLPSEWTAEQPGSLGSVSVSDSRVAISVPSGSNIDSISDPTDTDVSIGIVADLIDHGGDHDIAIQFDDDLSDLDGVGMNLMLRGDSASNAVRAATYCSPGANEGAAYHYAYARAGGSGAQIGTLGSFRDFSPSMMTGTPQWLRLAYDSSTSTWTHYVSTDGWNWLTVGSGVRSFTATTCKISVSTVNGASSLAATLHVNKVVDLIAQGTTDLRDDMPSTLYRTTVSTIDPTSDTSLPSDWTDDSEGSSTVTFVNGGTGTGYVRMYHDVSGDAYVGETSRFRYNGSNLTNCGLLWAMRNTTSRITAYFTGGLGNYDTDWIDQYAVGPGYALEVQNGPIRRPITINDPSNNPDYPDATTTTDLDETPYYHMKRYDAEYDMADDGLRWFRVERYDRRVRIKEWADGDSEPSTWNLYDGQIEQIDLDLAPALSLSHNGNDKVGDSVIEVTFVEFYELTDSVALVVADITVATTIDTVALTQTHELTVADLAVSSTIDTVTLTQTHELVVSDLSVASTIDTVTLEVQGDLVVADLTVPVTVDTVTLTQTHELVVADLTVGSSIDTVTITVDGIDLTVADLSVASTVDTVALTQVHNLTVADLAVAVTLDTVSLTQVHALTIADLAVAVSIDTVTLSDRPPDTDTRIAAVYRERAYAATYQEPAFEPVYREQAYAATYKGE